MNYTGHSPPWGIKVEFGLYPASTEPKRPSNLFLRAIYKQYYCIYNIEYIHYFTHKWCGGMYRGWTVDLSAASRLLDAACTAALSRVPCIGYIRCYLPMKIYTSNYFSKQIMTFPRLECDSWCRNYSDGENWCTPRFRKEGRLHAQQRLNIRGRRHANASIGNGTCLYPWKWAAEPKTMFSPQTTHAPPRVPLPPPLPRVLGEVSQKSHFFVYSSRFHPRKHFCATTNMRNIFRMPDKHALSLSVRVSAHPS